MTLESFASAADFYFFFFGVKGCVTSVQLKAFRWFVLVFFRLFDIIDLVLICILKFDYKFNLNTFILKFRPILKNFIKLYLEFYLLYLA